MSDQIDTPFTSLSKMSKVKVMNLKRQLRFYLEVRGMTAAELARRSGVSKQVLSSWLAGSEPKKIGQVKKVCSTLGVSLDHLVYGDGHEEENQRVTELDALLGDDWVSGVFEVRFRRIKKQKA